MQINWQDPFYVANAPPGPVEQNVAYVGYEPEVYGGFPPYSFAVTSGALPTGLALGLDGTITGMPTTVGVFTGTITCTDDDDVNSHTYQVNFSIEVIAPPAPPINVTNAPVIHSAIVDIVYGGFTAQVTGGVPPYSMSIVSGALPNGLTLNAAALTITGTPTVSGNYALVLRITDDDSVTFDFDYSVAVAPGASGLVMANQTLEYGASSQVGEGVVIPEHTGTISSFSITAGNSAGHFVALPNGGIRIAAAGVGNLVGPYTLTCLYNNGTPSQITRTHTINIVTGYSIASVAELQTMINRSAAVKSGATIRLRYNNWEIYDCATLDAINWNGVFDNLTSTLTITKHSGYKPRITNIIFGGTAGAIGKVTIDGLHFHLPLALAWSGQKNRMINISEAAADISIINCELSSDLVPARISELPNSQGPLRAFNEVTGKWYSTEISQALPEGNYVLPYRPDAIITGQICDNLLVENCYIHNCSHGISFCGHGCTIRNNEFAYLYGDSFNMAVNLYAGGGRHTKNVTFENNYIHDFMGHVDGYHHDCLQTYFTGSGASAGFGDMTDVVIRRNIYVMGYESPRMRRGDWPTDRTTGVQLFLCQELNPEPFNTYKYKRWTIEGNIMMGISGHGITFEVDLVDSVIRNNTLIRPWVGDTDGDGTPNTAIDGYLQTMGPTIASAAGGTKWATPPGFMNCVVAGNFVESIGTGPGAANTVTANNYVARNWDNLSIYPAAFAGSTFNPMDDDAAISEFAPKAGGPLYRVPSLGAVYGNIIGAIGPTPSAGPVNWVTKSFNPGWWGPILYEPVISAWTTTTITASIKTTGASGTLYWVATTSATYPTHAQIVAGQNHLGSAASSAGSTAVAAAGTVNINVSGLAVDTRYYLYATHVISGEYSANELVGSVVTEPPADSYGAEAVALFAQMDVQPMTSRKNAINTLIAAMKSAGVWSKLLYFYMFYSHTSQAALIDWKTPANDATLVSTPTFTANSGYVGGTGKAINLGHAQSELAQNNNHLGAWVTANTAANVIEHGSQNVWIQPRNSTGLFGSLNMNSTTPGVAVAASNGHSVISRSSPTSYARYKNGVALAAATVTSGVFAGTHNVYALARNNAGTMSSNSTRNTTCVHAGTALTAAEVSSLYTALNAFFSDPGGILP